MQERLDRLQDRASKRRQIAKDVMVELDLKKITAPDFSVSIRPASFMVIDEAAVPSIYWQPSAPRLKRQELLTELKDGAAIEGVAPPIRNRFEREGAVMGFSAKQLQALRRNLRRQAHSHASGQWPRALPASRGSRSEANRIFGLMAGAEDSTRLVLARETVDHSSPSISPKCASPPKQMERLLFVKAMGQAKGGAPRRARSTTSLGGRNRCHQASALATFGKPFWTRALSQRQKYRVAKSANAQTGGRRCTG
jgi:hypothetical protein